MTDINRLLTSFKRRSAHAKEFGDDITFVKLKDIDALVAVIEKSKEASGCPAGVDLQDWVKQLAAENVGLKASIPPLKMINDVTDSWDDVSLAEEVGFNLAISAIMKNIPDTPATDRIVAGIKADGVEEFAAYCGEENSVFVEAKAYYRSLPDAAYEFAKQLREGADK
ncbi:hypothetical protein [Klebsiella aerogenes]|uniref:hypothetical protein n=1 Tax=Klebsiella aerogenes TaxID=548 RepID=UPI001C8B9C7A|nr:hypothetical protein [Klebsiella aerogenes]MBX9066986.1 hypothetical protein [Klebsiella aerogenes]UAL36195.1 hypothetical protein K6006_09805 [Klebsiella aerogenes]